MNKDHDAGVVGPQIACDLVVIVDGVNRIAVIAKALAIAEDSETVSGGPKEATCLPQG